MFMYTVKSGDSLYSIAKKYNTTVDALKDLNNLTSTNLVVGQVLRIPEMYTPEDEISLPNYISYTVKRGDTIYSIAKGADISVDTIIKDNSLQNTNLFIGQILKIRISPGMSLQVEECFGPEYNPPDEENTIVYTVKKGDNLYNIARAYNITASQIISVNNLANTNLQIGQKLKIPVSKNNTSSSITYTVKKGDSLYAIAKLYNTTVDSIKKKNNLTSTNLSIGQKLLI